ncbi:hypothetical protein PsorP6_016749 [Peronosclerospora sorghi]|uniref:Uncharacterized protein n=1 Tax=Peronosclerospora sorghi TaxID=230839 RepID=A0ACC0WDY9_9STRA|nr:hypothetical protein PsorP6_016749 [Peronosclerospora sorghi]
MSSCRTWRYVTFDVTGTLVHPTKPIGETYLEFWNATSGQLFSSSRYEAAVSALTLQFHLEFRSRSHQDPNFGSTDTSNGTAFNWWRQLVLNVMKKANLADCLAQNEEQAERFTRDLYEHFGRPEAWKVYDDVIPTLEELAALNIPMGIISNFDERLESLLQALQLRDYFQVVTASFVHGEMKPQASIFQTTFEQLHREKGQFNASTFLHVGDHPVKDFKAAKDIGAQAKLLWRTQHESPPVNIEKDQVITTLRQLVTDNTTSTRFPAHRTTRNSISGPAAVSAE